MKEVTLLVYRDIETEGGFSRREYMGSIAMSTILWGEESPARAITDKLIQETGYRVDPDQLINLGMVYGSGVIYLYAANVSDLQPSPSHQAEWITVKRATASPDLMVSAMIQRLSLSREVSYGQPSS